jgi:hypothetical protein
LLKLEGIEIIRIDLVFNNKNLIGLMEKRGVAIKNQNFNLVKFYDEKIESIKDMAYYAEIIGAYVIYENQIDVKNALILYKTNLTVSRTLYENGITIHAAENPVDI